MAPHRLRALVFNFNYKVNFNFFYTKLCVCSHKWKIQNITGRIFLLSHGSCLRGETLGHWGYQGGIFFQAWSFFVYQIDGDDEQNRMQVAFSSNGQTGNLGVQSKCQISVTYQFQRFLYQTLRVFAQKRIKNILNRIFILLLGSCPRVGLGEVKNFSVGIWDGAPSTAHSSMSLLC